MNDLICEGLSFKSGKMSFDVCYSHLNQSSSRISIKGIIKPSNKEMYAFFQFYKEIGCEKKLADKWILDKSPKNEPYCCSSDVWDYKWSDKPKYNLGSEGKILFNTFVAEVEKGQHKDPEKWKYKVILGLSWGMTSNDGTKIEEIPIENIDKIILKDLVGLLQKEYPEAKFEIEDDLIKGNISDISGMW